MTSFFDKAKRQLLNKQLCVFLFLSFSTLFSATNAEDKDVSTLMSDDSQVCTSVNLPAEQDAVIHIYFGALILGTEKVYQTKIVHIPNSSDNKIAGIDLKKSQKTKAEKLVKIFLKKAIVSTKAKLDKKLYNPLSTESPNSVLFFKKSNPSVSSNNLQEFSKFQSPDIQTLVGYRKYRSQNTIFSYSQKRNLVGFYQIYKVRPPPFSWYSHLTIEYVQYNMPYFQQL